MENILEIFQNSYFSPPITRNTHRFHLALHQENLVWLLTVKAMKVCGCYQYWTPRSFSLLSFSTLSLHHFMTIAISMFLKVLTTSPGKVISVVIFHISCLPRFQDGSFPCDLSYLAVQIKSLSFSSFGFFLL